MAKTDPPPPPSSGKPAVKRPPATKQAAGNIPAIDPQELIPALLAALSSGLEFKHTPSSEEERATKLRIDEANAEHERLEKAKAADHERQEQAKAADHRRVLERRSVFIVTVAAAVVGVPCVGALMGYASLVDKSWAPTLLSTAFSTLAGFLAGRLSAPGNK